MNYREILNNAGVPVELHDAAVASIQDAERDIGWLNWRKMAVRLFCASKIARLMPWEAERLIEVRPDLADWDIAPNINITGHGDNAPWMETPNGGRPVSGRWLSKDTNSDEYKQAVAANYWCKGQHPRSVKSRAAWYRRNACEYAAWAKGKTVDLSKGINVWDRNDTVVYQCCDAWQIIHNKKIIGRLWWQTRIGYELDNVWNRNSRLQCQYPIEGYDLKAPVTWSNLPRLADK